MTLFGALHISFVLEKSIKCSCGGRTPVFPGLFSVPRGFLPHQKINPLGLATFRDQTWFVW